jgi:hypothetical protein
MDYGYLNAIHPWARICTLTRIRGCVMELPIIEPAPVVTEHAAVFRDVFEN